MLKLQYCSTFIRQRVCAHLEARGVLCPLINKMHVRRCLQCCGGKDDCLRGRLLVFPRTPLFFQLYSPAPKIKTS